MTDPIETLTTIRNSVLAELELDKKLLIVRKKDYDDSVRNVDQLQAMYMNLNLTIEIMKGREGPTPVNGEIAIPEYGNTDR